MYASLIDKFVGHRYGGTGLQQPFGGYATTNFATSYTFAEGLGALKSIKVGLQVNDLFDNKRLY